MMQESPTATSPDDVAPTSSHARLPTTERPARRRRKIDRGLLAASLAIAAGLLLVGFGVFVSVTGDDALDLPDEIEAISPVPDAVQVLSQTNVVVDLASGYTGVLVIDDVEIETVDLGEIDQVGAIEVDPGRQVEIPPVTVFEPGNSTLTFTPSEAAAISEFSTGLHRVQVIYWRIDEGRSSASSYTWVFNVV
jgi:hypothetical protein